MQNDGLVVEEAIAQNFLVFGESPQRIQLDTSLVTAIMGRDLDIAGGTEKNGVGKSTIIDLLSYVWFGKSLRGIPNDELYNDSTKKPMLGIVHWRKDGLRYRAERGVNPSRCRLYARPVEVDEPWTATEIVDGKKQPKYDISEAKNPLTTAKIERLLGFNLKLLQILLAHSSEAEPFFLLEEADRRKIMETLFGFEVLSERAEHLKDPVRKEIQRDLIAKESAAEATRQANVRIEQEISRLEAASVQWEQDKAKRQAELQSQIKAIEGTDPDKEIEVLAALEELRNHIRRVSSEHAAAVDDHDSIVAQHKAWATRRQSAVATLKAQIGRLEGADPDADIAAIAEVDKHAQDLVRARNELRTFTVNASATLAEKKRIDADISKLKRALTEESEKLTSIDANTCPTCGQPWESNHQHRVATEVKCEAMRAEIRTQEMFLSQVVDALQDDNKELERLQGTVKLLEQNKPSEPSTFKTVAEAAGAKTLLDAAREQLAEKEREPNPYAGQIDTAREKVTRLEASKTESEDAQKEFAGLALTYRSVTEAQAAKTKLATYRQTLNDLAPQQNPHVAGISRLRTEAIKPVNQKAIDDLRTDLDHLNFLIQLLTDKDSFIRKAIISRWLPKLNEKLNGYLERFELPYRIYFMPDTTAEIVKPGRDKKYYFRALSKGQRTRVWIATNLAFRDLCEMMTQRINLLFIDELLDHGLSERGAGLVFGVLDEFAQGGIKRDPNRRKSVFVITHRQDIADRARKVLTVEKQFGFSKIIEQAVD